MVSQLSVRTHYFRATLRSVNGRPGESPTARLGRLIQTRRQILGMTQLDLATAAGMSVGTISQVEQGRRESQGVKGKNRPAVERALRWVPGSIQAILDGGEPVELPASSDVGLTGVELDPNVRGLIDEVMLTSPEDLPRLVAMLKALTRSWRDQQG